MEGLLPAARIGFSSIEAGFCFCTFFGAGIAPLVSLFLSLFLHAFALVDPFSGSVLTLQGLHGRNPPERDSQSVSSTLAGEEGTEQIIRDELKCFT